MPRTNRTTYVVLGLLADGPLSGYDIKRTVEDVIGHFWRESFGQIYPVLARAARRGLVRREPARGAGARRRILYRLTPAGRRALAEWLATPPEPETVRNEMLLRVFFGRSTAPAVLRGHLEGFRTRARSLQAYFTAGEAEIRTLPEPQRTYWLLTLRSGQLVVDARLRWVEEAIARLAPARRSRRSG